MIQGGSRRSAGPRRLGLADRLVDGPRTVAELASLTSTDHDGLGRLLRAAATVGLFSELGDDRFELTPLGAQLGIGDAAGHSATSRSR